MNPAEISAAIKAYLGSPGIPGLQMIWPNTEVSPIKPYVMIHVDLLGAKDITIDASRATISGVLRALIVTDEGVGDRPANTFAYHLTSLLTPPVNIPFAGGLIEIVDPVEVKAGYPQGAAWRVPVEVSFSAHA